MVMLNAMSIFKEKLETQDGVYDIEFDLKVRDGKLDDAELRELLDLTIDMWEAPSLELAMKGKSIADKIKDIETPVRGPVFFKMLSGETVAITWSLMREYENI